MPVIDSCITDEYAIYHADCMEVLPTLPAESIGLSVYSPPFPELYQYSDDPRDMCNCVNYDESIQQYRYIVGEISRLTKPGRISAVHCTDLKRGQLYQHDFPGDIIRVHREFDMHFFCRVCIWKDPWEFARRTRMKSLMHKQVSVIDSADCRVAPADYVLIFKKAGKNTIPIKHEKGFRYYAGARPLPSELVRDYANYKGDPRGNLLSHWIWRQYASPVWMDIRRGRLLGGTDGHGTPKLAKQAKEIDEEKHVCPLQLDVIDRCLSLWSNPGETILTPFMGIGSEVYEAVANGRKAIGIELKATYYRQAERSLKTIRETTDQQFTLGDNTDFDQRDDLPEPDWEDSETPDVEVAANVTPGDAAYWDDSETAETDDVLV